MRALALALGPPLALVLALALVLVGCVSPAEPAALASGPIPDAKGLLVYDSLGQPASAPSELASGFRIDEVLVGHRGGEPNIGVTPKGNVFMTSGHNTLRSQDHGQSWEIVFNLSTALPQSCDPVPRAPPPAPGCPVTQFTRSSDPMLWVDPDTGRIFTDHMTGLWCSNMIISEDEGDSWTMKPMTCGSPGNDHQKVATSKPGPKAPPLPHATYPNVVYYCYNKAAVAFAIGTTMCAVSLNGGYHFEYERAVANFALDGCGGINGHPAPHPDGTIFVPITLGCDGPMVGVSEDNGLTWTVQKGPTEEGSEELDADITVTPDGTAYLLARGKDHLQYLYRSADKFATWDGPFLVSPPGVLSTVFAGITSGDDGRIALAYLGTRDTDEEPSEAANETRWHLFVSYSFDAAAESPTFVTQQVTPDEDPVQIGCVWLRGGGNPCRNLLDFIDMTSDVEGRVFVAFTDGCTTNCSMKPDATNEASRARDGAVAVLVDGPSLRAETGWIRP